MIRAVISGVVCAAVTFAAAAAGAASIYSSIVENRYSSGLHPGDTLHASATLAPFDSSLGTLDSVRIGIRGDGGAELTLTNLLPGPYMWTGFVRISLFGPDGTSLFAGRQAIDYAYPVLIDAAGDTWACDNWNSNCVTPWPAVGIAPFTLRMTIGNSYGYYVDLYDNLDMFTSAAQLSATAQFEIPVRGPSVGPDFVVLPPDASGGGFGFLDLVEYTYTPIPEPSTALLVGLGLAFIGMYRAQWAR